MSKEGLHEDVFHVHVGSELHRKVSSASSTNLIRLDLDVRIEVTSEYPYTSLAWFFPIEILKKQLLPGASKFFQNPIMRRSWAPA